MDANATAALALRRDCENLNLDTLLLSGLFAHPCLPLAELCDAGGAPETIRGRGYRCDNEVRVDRVGDALVVRPGGPAALARGRVYRLTVDAPAHPLVVTDARTGAVLSRTGVAVGAAYFAVDASTPDRVAFASEGLAPAELAVAPAGGDRARAKGVATFAADLAIGLFCGLCVLFFCVQILRTRAEKMKLRARRAPPRGPPGDPEAAPALPMCQVLAC